MGEYLSRHKQVLLFVVARGMSAVIEIGCFKFFSIYIPLFLPKEIDFYGIHYPLSNIFSTLGGIFSNYFFSIWFVFERGKHSKKREFVYFMGISLVSTLFSLLFFQVFYRYVFTDNLYLSFYTLSPQMISKICAILLVSLLNYSVKKRVIFNG